MSSLIVVGSSALSASVVTSVLIAFNALVLLSFNAFFVVPVGAIVIGWLCGLGAVVASYFVGLRLSLPVLFAGGLLQVALYLGLRFAEYTAYYAALPQDAVFPELSFWSFFQIQAEDRVTDLLETMHLQRSGASATWGLALVFRGLQLGGFVYGGMFTLHWLSKRPRCASCARYLRQKTVVGLPVSVHDVRGESEEDRLARQHQVERLGVEEANRLLAAVETGAPQTMKEALTQAREFAFEYRRRGPQRLLIQHEWCTGCGAGAVTSTLVTSVGEEEVHERVAEAKTSGGSLSGVLYS